MIRKAILILSFFSAAVLSHSSLYASKNKPFAPEEEAQAYLVTHYNSGCKSYNQQDWKTAADEFEKVIYFFPTSDTAAEASYFLGVSYFEMREYDFANAEFSAYLKASTHPEFFEKAVYYKFCIAEYFKAGYKKRPFKFRYFPKWASGKNLALTIYDEVIAALPNHELTVQALYSKANLLKQLRECREAVETYQTIIRRFPRHEIIPDCYLEISDAYYQQALCEFQNPDILALAELNAIKFREEFPRDERVAIVENSVRKIKETYAKGLCDLALLYERMGQPAAAAIYYQSAIEEFPDTRVSQFCYSRLVCLGYKAALEAEEDVLTLPPLNSESAEEGNGDSADSEMGAFVQEFPQGYPEFTNEAPPESFDPPVYYPYCEEEISQSEAEAAIADGVPIEIVDDNVKEVPPTYIHYSLIKKRDVKHVPPRH